MTATLTYTPPDLPDGSPGPVRRRHVFYIHGYDPQARTRYRMLFVRELSRYARRFGEPPRVVSRPSLSADDLVQSWRVAALPEVEGAETSYDVLLWDDIVARDFARWRLVSVGLLLAGILHWLVTGLVVRFYRLNWKMGNVILYPAGLVILLALGVGLIATIVQACLGDGFALSAGLPLWLSLPLGLATGLAATRPLERLLNQAFFWQLLNDWVFNWQHGNGWRPDFERRIETMTDHVVETIRDLSASGDPPDEIMIVGHSSGAQTAVEVTARALSRDAELGTGLPSLSLVTIGSGVPLVAMQTAASGLRREIAGLVTSRRLTWAEYQAPQDWMNFPGFNPVRHLGLDLAGRPITNPLLRSAKFREIIAPETYVRIRAKPFRMHFQFLIANDRRGDYDFFAMVLGPQRLRERVLAPIVPGEAADGASARGPSRRSSSSEAPMADDPSPTVLVVMGVSGSGKSTVAALLAERLGWAFADGDAFHSPDNVAKMQAGIGLGDGDRTPWLASIAAWIDRHLAEGRSGVIVCSALKRSYRSVLVRGRSSVRIVYLSGEQALIAERLAERLGHFMPAGLLDSQFAALEPPGLEERPVVVTIAHGPEIIVADILDRLGDAP